MIKIERDIEMSFNRKISIIQIGMYLILAYCVSRIHLQIIVFSPLALMLLIKVFQIATNKWKLALGNVGLNVVLILSTAVNLNSLWYWDMILSETWVVVFVVTSIVSIISAILDIVTVIKEKNT